MVSFCFVVVHQGLRLSYSRDVAQYWFETVDSYTTADWKRYKSPCRTIYN